LYIIVDLIEHAILPAQVSNFIHAILY